MRTGHKVSLKFNLLWITAVFICSITLFATGNYKSPNYFYKTLTVKYDTIPTKPVNKTDTNPTNKPDTNPTNKLDTNVKKIQKIDTLNVKVSKDSLDAPVTYTAADSMV